MILIYLSSKPIAFRRLLILGMLGVNLSFAWAKEKTSSLQKQGTALVAPQEPISIDADDLQVFESKHQAVFKGNVHAIQDEVHLRCSQLTVSYARTPHGSTPPLSSKKIPDESAVSSETSLAEGMTITSLECEGPVTITSEDQVVTGKHASFDNLAQAIRVSGDAKLVKGSNILTGDRILYSLADRVARVEGHVKALFAPKEGGIPQNSSHK